MKRAIAAALCLLALAGCASMKEPTSLAEMQAFRKCSKEWKVVGATAGCRDDPWWTVTFDKGELDNEFIIAILQDDPNYNGCWRVTDHKDWAVTTCDLDIASAAATEFGGELVGL